MLIKKKRQHSVLLYCHLLSTRQSAYFIGFSKHPYEKRPFRCPLIAPKLVSSLTLGRFYSFDFKQVQHNGLKTLHRRVFVAACLSLQVRSTWGTPQTHFKSHLTLCGVLLSIPPSNTGIKRKRTPFRCPFSFGDPWGNRTPVTAVKGRCLNLLTNGPGSGSWT